MLAIAALYFGRRVFIPLALAVVFSFLLTPLVILLERIRFRRFPAVLVVLALSFALVGSVGWGVAGQLVEIMVDLPDYKANLDTKIQALHPSKDGNLSKATATVHELNKELAAVPEEIASGHAQGKQTGTGQLTRPIPVHIAAPPSTLFQDLRALLGPLAGPIETAAIVIIFTLFMLVKREDLRNRAIRLAGRGQLTLMTQALDDAGHRLSRYLLLQCLVNGSYGLLFGLALYFIGVPHALFWGVLAGLLRFVPYVGALIGAALPTVMALAVFPGWHHAGLTFAAFAVLELTISNVVEPLLYGAHTGISSIAILVAAVFWATLFDRHPGGGCFLGNAVGAGRADPIHSLNRVSDGSRTLCSAVEFFGNSVGRRACPATRAAPLSASPRHGYGGSENHRGSSPQRKST